MHFLAIATSYLNLPTKKHNLMRIININRHSWKTSDFIFNNTILYTAFVQIVLLI